MYSTLGVVGFFAVVASPALAVKDIRAGNVSSSLKFKEDGTFQINVFEDLHFGDQDIQDTYTLQVMNDILDTEPADFVVINGDLLDRASTFRDNRTDYVDQLLQPLIKRDLTWGSTYGNHDHTVNTSAAMILEVEQQYSNCRTKKMVHGREPGVSNYFLPVYAADCTGCNCTPDLLLWFFDSRGGFYYGEHKEDGSFVEQPSWVDASAATWFQQESARLQTKFDKVIPSLVFVHIPIYASEAFQLSTGIDPNLQPGINDAMPMAQQAYGFCPDGRYNKDCLYGGQDVPFMQAVATTPGVMALFNAHEHGNTWCYKWDTQLTNMTFSGEGVNLCFGQHTGYGGNGDWIRGARQILVNQTKLSDGELDTWIRLEDGDIVGSVSLNATYNNDMYPATPNDKTYIN